MALCQHCRLVEIGDANWRDCGDFCRSVAAKKAKQRAYMARYRRTKKFAEAKARYLKSEKGRKSSQAAMARYRRTKKFAEAKARYLKSEKGRESMRESMRDYMRSLRRTGGAAAERMQEAVARYRIRRKFRGDAPAEVMEMAIEVWRAKRVLTQIGVRESRES